MPPTNAGYLELLDMNLEVFNKDTAQILEYWLDVSYFCRWRKPAKKLPWKPEIVALDGRAYAERGIRHVTSFALWIDRGYVRTFGDPPLDEYVRALQQE